MARAKSPSAPATPKFSPAVCALVIAVALFILLHESLIGGKGLVPVDAIFGYPPWSTTAVVEPSNYLLVDQYLDLVPSRQFFHDQVLQGRFPLWNPYLMCGVPSLASMQGAMLYPLNLLLSPISPFVASGLAAFAKLFIAAFFTFLFLRRLGLVSAAALVGALTFALSGFLIVWLGHPHANVAVMLPVLFYCVEAAMARPRAIRPWIGLAVSFGVMLLGGHPPTAVHVTLALAAYVAFRLFRQTNRLTFALSLVMALGAGAIIAAPQMLPFAEYSQLSSSNQSSESLKRWASHLPPVTLVHYLLPYVSGSPSTGFEHLPKVMGLGPVENFNERTGYVGILALFLAGVAALRRRCAFSFFFGGLAGVALAIIYGVPPWPSIMRALPVLASINHERFILVLDWCAAVLAALGADTLMAAKPAERPGRLALLFVTGVTIAIAALWIFVGGAAKLDAEARSFLAGQFPVFIGGLVAAVMVTRRWLGPRWIPTLCIGWTAVDLLWFGMGYNPAIPREHYYPATGAIRFLQADPSVFRVFSAGPTLIPSTAQVYGLSDVRGRDFMSVARYEELITGRAGDFFFYETARNLPASIASLNAKYVLTPARNPAFDDSDLVYDKEIAIYKNPRFHERAMIVFDHRVEPDQAALLEHVRDRAFDPGQMVWFDTQPAASPAELNRPIAGEATEARVTHYEPDLVTVEAKLPQAGFLVLFDTYFPGWTATVDGRETPIYRANYTFRAVALSAGTHTVAFAYRPMSFRLGLAASGIVLVALTALWFRKPRQARPD